MKLRFVFAFLMIGYAKALPANIGDLPKAANVIIVKNVIGSTQLFLKPVVNHAHESQKLRLTSSFSQSQTWTKPQNNYYNPSTENYKTLTPEPTTRRSSVYQIVGNGNYDGSLYGRAPVTEREKSSRTYPIYSSSQSMKTDQIFSQENKNQQQTTVAPTKNSDQQEVYKDQIHFRTNPNQEPIEQSSTSLIPTFLVNSGSSNNFQNNHRDSQSSLQGQEPKQPNNLNNLQKNSDDRWSIANQSGLDRNQVSNQQNDRLNTANQSGLDRNQGFYQQNDRLNTANQSGSDRNHGSNQQNDRLNTANKPGSDRNQETNFQIELENNNNQRNYTGYLTFPDTAPVKLPDQKYKIEIKYPKMDFGNVELTTREPLRRPQDSERR